LLAAAAAVSVRILNVARGEASVPASIAASENTDPALPPSTFCPEFSSALIVVDQEFARLEGIVPPVD
jgi:hypothetical protein